MIEEEGEFADRGKVDFSGRKKQDRFFRPKKAGSEKIGPKKQGRKNWTEKAVPKKQDRFFRAKKARPKGNQKSKLLLLDRIFRAKKARPKREPKKQAAFAGLYEIFELAAVMFSSSKANKILSLTGFPLP
jgi:hypothetical protein